MWDAGRQTLKGQRSCAYCTGHTLVGQPWPLLPPPGLGARRLSRLVEFPEVALPTWEADPAQPGMKRCLASSQAKVQPSPSWLAGSHRMPRGGRARLWVWGPSQVGY